MPTGVVRLGGAVVLHEHQRGVRPDRELAHEAIVGPGVAEHPAAAMHVEHDGKGSRRAGGLHDADRDVADLRRDGDPGLVDVGLGDRRRLDVVEDLAGAVRLELVEERGLRGGVGDLLSRRLQDVRGLGDTPLPATEPLAVEQMARPSGAAGGLWAPSVAGGLLQIDRVCAYGGRVVPAQRFPEE
jgi:hypothetical protein